MTLEDTPATQRLPCGVLWIGLLLTALGSSYFHWAPSEETLLWDRLPMALGFTGAIGAIATERLGAAAGLRWFLAWLYLSLLSVALATVALDIRLYLVAQYGGFLVLLFWTSRPAVQGHARLPWGAMLACYGLAKLFELGDGAIWRLTDGAFSGHPWKHVIAALGLVPVLLVLTRKPTMKAGGRG